MSSEARWIIGTVIGTVAIMTAVVVSVMAIRLPPPCRTGILGPLAHWYPFGRGATRGFHHGLSEDRRRDRGDEPRKSEEHCEQKNRRRQSAGDGQAGNDMQHRGVQT